MNSKLIIDVNKRSGNMRIAVLADGTLVEYRQQRKDAQFVQGDIYLGVVRRVLHNQNAAFVDIGGEKEAYLPLKGIADYYEGMLHWLKHLPKHPPKDDTPPDLSKLQKKPKSPPGEKPTPPKIGDRVKSGQTLMVQIVRESYSQKGATVSTEISLAGRNLVLLPFESSVHVSSRIDPPAESQRLKRLLLSLVPPGLGVIIRTAAQEKGASELDLELKALVARWHQLNQAVHAQGKVPRLLLQEENGSVSLMRDNLNGSYSEICVNERELYNDLRTYLQSADPSKMGLVKHYTSPKVSIFDHYGVNQQIRRSLGRMVLFHKGAYLIVEHTEAFHVIDVNSGRSGKKAESPELMAFEINLAACDEVARQLKLRDMGGIIVIDFIDMSEPGHRKAIYSRMVELMQADKVPHKILELSAFGLMQITRQRVRPEQSVDTAETCAACGGTGKLDQATDMDHELRHMLELVIDEHKEEKLKLELHVHPYVASFYNQSFGAKRRKLAKELSCKLKILPEESYSLMQYQLFDDSGRTLKRKK